MSGGGVLLLRVVVFDGCGRFYFRVMVAVGTWWVGLCGRWLWTVDAFLCVILMAGGGRFGG